MNMGKPALAISAFLGTALAAGAVMAQDLIGQPTDGALGLQPGASPLKQDAIWFHDAILLPMCIGISVLVLGLLVWVVIRYNKKANPVPARWSHNTLVEVVWTIVPVFILVGIALFSFRLLFAYENMPEPDMTIKATGNQWNWSYEYPDQGVAEFYSSMLPEDEVARRGMPSALYRLAVDEPIVVPVGKTVKVLVTASDVIHSFALPAFGLKTDAIPGRTNETWFKADRVGTFYGQCSELCGVDHAFMPIEIRVVSEADFAAWVASKGGSMTAAADAEAAAAAPVAAPAAAPAAIDPASAVAPTPAPAPAPAAAQ
ncbi:cytochrome c oxidase subunit II [Brevundimonas sp.]|jgi:cytochrome c oxidase subunit II|uniref:cytochrome c oxidase subunit II n=1 Tax=Brevundimonas sp. TaxID=1871086 RepID=UPI002614802C|nr:cytochrome c oxidase subunit II [Brevundimonas sp.]